MRSGCHWQVKLHVFIDIIYRLCVCKETVEEKEGERDDGWRTKREEQKEGERRVGEVIERCGTSIQTRDMRYTAEVMQQETSSHSSITRHQLNSLSCIPPSLHQNKVFPSHTYLTPPTPDNILVPTQPPLFVTGTPRRYGNHTACCDSSTASSSSHHNTHT